MGIPQKITVDLARLNNSTIFIETGTFYGGTTRWASNYGSSGLNMLNCSTMT